MQASQRLTAMQGDNFSEDGALAPAGNHKELVFLPVFVCFLRGGKFFFVVLLCVCVFCYYFSGGLWGLSVCHVRWVSVCQVVGAVGQSVARFSNSIYRKKQQLAVGQHQWYHLGVGEPPILVYFSWDWDVHWGVRFGF